jgi:predicted phosphohydrolase
MKRFAWMTDVHLNFLEAVDVDQFLTSVAGTESDGVLLSGDIGEAPDVVPLLKAFADRLDRPIYFVLGNHDFYRGSIAGVREKVKLLCAACPNLCWLSNLGVVAMTEQTALVGHDGWGDGRIGDYWGSSVSLNDWYLIEELAWLDQKERLAKLHSLGDEAAVHFRAVLPDALQRYRNVLVVTHVPPFREACWYNGSISDEHWLPHFTCKAVGEVLAGAMAARNEKQMTVLCGHSHGKGEVRILPNLHVLTGGAQYGHPQVQRVLEVE